MWAGGTGRLEASLPCRNPPNAHAAMQPRTSTRSSTITASGMWLAARPPGPGGGPRPRLRTALSDLTLLPLVSRFWPAGDGSGQAEAVCSESGSAAGSDSRLSAAASLAEQVQQRSWQAA